MGPRFRGDDGNIESRRNRFGELFVNLILDWRERAQRLGRERDRLTVTVGRSWRSACCGFARQRVKRGADAAAEVDQFALAAACGDRKRQRVQMAPAIAEQRQ